MLQMWRFPRLPFAINALLIQSTAGKEDQVRTFVVTSTARMAELKAFVFADRDDEEAVGSALVPAEIPRSGVSALGDRRATRDVREQPAWRNLSVPADQCTRLNRPSACRQSLCSDVLMRAGLRLL
jgi:hypothetical protein